MSVLLERIVRNSSKRKIVITEQPGASRFMLEIFAAMLKELAEEMKLKVKVTVEGVKGE